MTVANVISGTGTVNQVGDGTTSLTGANTYSGTTTISAGTLQHRGRRHDRHSSAPGRSPTTPTSPSTVPMR